MTRKISPQQDGCRAESLTGPARQVHQAALAEFARAGQPPARSDLEQLARSLGTSPDAVLAELASADVIAFSPGGQIRCCTPATPGGLRSTPAGNRRCPARSRAADLRPA